MSGQTLAIVGLAVSVITLLFGLILGALLMPVFLKAREKAHEVSRVPERVMEVSEGSDCINNMKHLALGLIMYSNDWDEMLPPADRWSEAISPYIKSTSLYVCPQAPQLRCGYALNRVIAGKREDMTSGNPKAAPRPGLGDTLRGALGNETPSKAAVGAVEPAQVVMLFESDRGWNGSGGPEALPKVPRHNGGDFYAFWDGHCKWVRRGHETTLEWSPKVPRGK